MVRGEGVRDQDTDLTEIIRFQRQKPILTKCL
ncbi:MAG: hypothetical protein RIS92_239 [Verrucomicrobiota bacterium]|jgi:hypothetical protein